MSVFTYPIVRYVSVYLPYCQVCQCLPTLLSDMSVFSYPIVRYVSVYHVDSEMFARFLNLRILRSAFCSQNLIPANMGFNMYANILDIGRGPGCAKIKLSKHADEAETAKLSTCKYFRIYSSICTV